MNKKLNNRYTTKKRKSSNKKRTLRNKTKLGKQQRKRRVVQIGGISDGEIIDLIKTKLDDTELLDSDGRVKQIEQTEKVREIIDEIIDEINEKQPSKQQGLVKSHTSDGKTVLYVACSLKIPSRLIVRDLLKHGFEIKPNKYPPCEWPQHGAVLAAIDILNDDTILAVNKYDRLKDILDILKQLKSNENENYNSGKYGKLPLMAQRYDFRRPNAADLKSGESGGLKPGMAVDGDIQRGATALVEFDEKLKPLIHLKLSDFSSVSDEDLTKNFTKKFTDVLDYTPKYTDPR